MMNQTNEALTDFQRKVYEACSQIPAGKVSTYGLLAKAISCGSAQAVGQALKVNPFAPEVPCHRVVKTDRSIGGFFGQREGAEVTRKVNLLKEEGVKFDERGRVAQGQLWAFSREG
ncbi:MGMT family protein [Kiritimatiellota bacterium B12222]|nr:MGMT family protein [Kiritimatiellota bacterium B12222]